MKAQLRALASHAFAQSLSELAQACPDESINDALYVLAREAICQMRAYSGASSAAETFYRLADELAVTKDA